MSRLVHLLRDGLPLAMTSVVAMLATFGSALAMKYAVGFSDSLLVLAVVLAVSMSRRQTGKSSTARWFALLVLPLVSVGATEIGTQLFERPNLGDTLFIVAVSASIWSRRFGGTIARLGSVAALPLIAILVAPVAVAGSGSGASSRWWAATVAVIALFWVTVCFTVAERGGWLAAAPVTTPRRSPSRAAVIDRMALRILVSLTLAFVLGRWLFGYHWPWLVITAFVVSSGGAEHGEVLWRALQRVVGAGVGTLGATLLTSVVPTGSTWAIVLIFAVLAIGVWLRPINYAFWASGITAVLALLYGYYGERGGGLLLDRLEEIALGAALTVLVSWLVTRLPLPASRTDPLRDATLRVLGYVNRRHGFGYQLVRRMPSGGYLVRDSDSDAILVWSRDRSVSLPATDAVANGATPSGYPYVLSTHRSIGPTA